MNLYCTDKKNLFNKYIICLFLLIPTLIIFSKFVAELIIIIINFYIILNYKKCFQNIDDFKEENKENFKIFFIFFLFFLYIFLNSIFNTKNIIDAFKSLFLMRFAVILLLPILIIQKINKNLILLFIVMTTLAFNVDIFYQFLNGINILGYKHNEEYSRYAGLFKNELIAGSYLFFIFFLLLLLHSISSYKKIILFIIFITYIAIYISGDRQPFLSLNLAILILIIINFKNILKYVKKKKIFLIFILILTFFISQNKINLLTKKYTNIVEYIKITDIKDTNYYYHYSKAFLIFKSHFFFGAGYKSFRIECSNPIYDDLTKNSLDKRHFNGCTTHPHNFYFELLSELGIVGFSIFIFTLFNLLKICFSNIKNNLINKYQYKILLAFLLSYFFPFKPTGSIYTNFSLIMFFFVITFFIFIKKNYSNIKNV